MWCEAVTDVAGRCGVQAETDVAGRCGVQAETDVAGRCGVQAVTDVGISISSLEGPLTCCSSRLEVKQEQEPPFLIHVRKSHAAKTLVSTHAYPPTLPQEQSRIIRLARGSGRSPQEVLQLLEAYKHYSKYATQVKNCAILVFFRITSGSAFFILSYSPHSLFPHSTLTPLLFPHNYPGSQGRKPPKGDA